MEKTNIVACRNPTSRDASDDEEATWSHAWGLISGFAVSITLKTAIELGIIDALTNAAGRALTVDELAAQLPAPDKAGSAASVDRLLRLLAAFDVVRCSTETGPDCEAVRKYTPAPVCRWLTSNRSDGSLAPLAMFAVDQDYLPTWNQLGAAVVCGVPPPFERAHGMPLFEYMGKNPRLSGVFNQAMFHMSVTVISKMVERFDGFDGVEVLVDVGGGTGAALEMITARHKHIKGINFDLPYVITQAPSLPGVENIAGNMFESVPTGDAIFLKWILHLQNDDDCIKILKNCHRALPANGKVIVVEIVLPTTTEATREAQDMFLLDVIMFNNLQGGKERTEQDFLKMARSSGFDGAFRSTYIFGNFWALEFTK
ncbi:hypothetical protein ACQJBY_024576 [Aegilops geniculata]